MAALVSVVETEEYLDEATTTTVRLVTTSDWLDRATAEGKVTFFEQDKITVGERKLGAGAFSHVYEGTLTSGSPYSSIPVAVKRLRDFVMERPIDEGTSKELIKELKYLRNVDFHPSILRFYGVSKDERTYMLILEYADGGSLREYLAKNFSGLTDDDKLRHAKEIAKGVACLHDQEIIHKDLNSENILVHGGKIKISLLGLSKRATMETVGEISVPRGNLPYVDPQSYINVNYVQTEESDIYSIGVVFWELTSGRPPFPKLGSTVIAYLINGRREAPIKGTPQAFVDLYTKCWDGKPENRPNIGQVCEALDKLIKPSIEEPATRTSEDNSPVNPSKAPNKQKRKSNFLGIFGQKKQTSSEEGRSEGQSANSSHSFFGRMTQRVFGQKAKTEEKESPNGEQ